MHYKFVYFDGKERKFHGDTRLSSLKKVAGENPSVYQIISVALSERVVWERACENIEG